MDRLLILSCSACKSTTTGRVPTIDRYDGPAFHVLRKYLREDSSRGPTVLILSAKYGLIASERQIPSYDHRLTNAAAICLRPQVLEAARRVLQSRSWQVVGVCAGKEYRTALSGLADLLPAGARLVELGGGLGKRLSALRGWLHQDCAPASVGAAPPEPGQSARVTGSAAEAVEHLGEAIIPH